MTPEQLSDLHDSVFWKTAQDPTWLGFWIDRFLRSEKLSRDDLARDLGVTPERLVLLCLCYTPKLETFREDVQAVCSRTGAKEEVVARIVRQEQALQKWQSTPFSTNKGWLLAASDRDETSTSTPRDVESGKPRDDHESAD